MLVHYFGSRDELLVAIVREVERRQTAMLDELPDHPGEAFAAMWADVRRPEMRPLVRLFFECYARGAQGEAPFDSMHPGAVEGWLAEVHERTHGTSDAAKVRLGLASLGDCCSTSSQPVMTRVSTLPQLHSWPCSAGRSGAPTVYWRSRFGRWVHCRSAAGLARLPLSR